MVKAAARALQVWMNGEHVGTWLHPRGGNHSFTYAPSWLASPRVRALSLSLPITPGIAEVRGQPVQSYFENLLPDSEAIRRRLLCTQAAAESLRATAAT